VRRATRRELAVLEAELTASLLAAEDLDLGAAIADHEALRRRREAAAPEIVARRLTPGRVARLRPRREAADAERALQRLHALT
jgi:hypothetical protein